MCVTVNWPAPTSRTTATSAASIRARWISGSCPGVEAELTASSTSFERILVIVSGRAIADIVVRRYRLTCFFLARRLLAFLRLLAVFFFLVFLVLAIGLVIAPLVFGNWNVGTEISGVAGGWAIGAATPGVVNVMSGP